MLNQSQKWLLSWLIALCLLMTGRHGQAEPIHVSPEEILPENTLLYLDAQNIDQLIEKFKTTSTWQFSQDPAVRPFIDDFKEKIQPKIDEFFEEMWGEIGMENPPDTLPQPKGQVVIAVVIQPRTVTFTVEPYDDFEQEENEQQAPAAEPIVQERTVPDFQIIALAQMGDDAESLQQIINQCTDKMIEDGAFRQVEPIDGVDFQIIKKDQDVDPDFDTPIYGFKDDLLIAGSSLKYIRQIMRKLDGSDDSPSLAQRQNISAIRKDRCSGDLFFYFNARTCIDQVMAIAPENEKEEGNRVLQLLGMDCLQGVAMSLSIAEQDTEDMRLKALVSIPETKKGLFAMLAPTTGPMTPGRLIAKNVYAMMIANYDFPTFYDQLIYLISAISRQNIGMIVQSSMAMTGDPQQAGQPPVDLRQEVIAPLTSPIAYSVSITSPYTMENQKPLISIAVRDRATLDHALARIHATFIASGNPDLRREFLETNLYLLPANPMMFMMMGPGMSSPGQPPMQWAFAVTPDHLVFGPVDAVEQAIRDGRKDTPETIAVDPTYQYARKFIPDQAGMMSFTNTQINMEIIWNLLKELARQAEQMPDQSMNDMPMNPMMMYAYMLKEINQYFDMSLLPDFTAVKKHFGPNVTYMKQTDDGIYMESICLKAPPMP